MNILQINNFNLSITVKDKPLKILNDIMLSLYNNKINTIIGESGCGKSLLCKSILKLLPVGSIYSGSIWCNYQNIEYNLLSDRDLRQLRGNQISLLFQNPSVTLNPVLKCGSQIIDILLSDLKLTKSSALKNALELLARVYFQNPEEIFWKYPHELSGGEKQRFALALAIGCNPSLLIADEPLSSLDVTLKHKYFELIQKLKEELNMTLLWVTHDLKFARQFSDHIFVMYCGNIIESGTVNEVFQNPSHPYTRALLKSFQSFQKERPESIKGNISDFQNLTEGCNFHPRCENVQQQCIKSAPEYLEITPTHKVKCFNSQK